MRSPSERRKAICALAILSVFIPYEVSAAPNFDPDVTKWQEVKAPPKSRPSDWIVWSFAAGDSKLEWQVKRDGNVIRATLVSNPTPKSSSRPNFVPKAEQFVGADAVQRVDDGWLVGFNQGEFGAALYWFSEDGRQKYKISDDQVVDFMRTPKGIIAIEGLAHLSISQGSLIGIARHSKTKRWRSTTIQELPEAPEAFIRLSNDTLIVVLSDSLVSFSPDYKMTTLVKCADWGSLYSNSAVASPDESRIYIGMRQFVVEFELNTHRLKYLIPDQSFLNRLPKEEEKRLREVYKEGFAHEKNCD